MAVADYATLPGARLQPVLIDQLQSFLAAIVDIGESDQVRNDLTGRVITVVLTLQVNTVCLGCNLVRKLGLQVPFQVNEFAIGSLLQHRHGIAVIETEFFSNAFESLGVRKHLGRVHPNRINRRTDG